MIPLGIDYATQEPPRCDQCRREMDQHEDRYQCNCGVMLCVSCYSNCKECGQ